MNKLFKSLIYDMQVSLSVLETTEMVNDAIKVHNLDDTAAETLGGLLTACAALSNLLSFYTNSNIFTSFQAENRVFITCTQPL